MNQKGLVKTPGSWIHPKRTTSIKHTIKPSCYVYIYIHIIWYMYDIFLMFLFGGVISYPNSLIFELPPSKYIINMGIFCWFTKTQKKHDKWQGCFLQVYQMVQLLYNGQQSTLGALAVPPPLESLGSWNVRKSDNKTGSTGKSSLEVRIKWLGSQGMLWEL